MTNVQFPEAFAFLFQPSRYKVAYGGRGSGKSWAIARALLLLGAQKPLRILCARELQRSIADSVHKLLSDQIGELGLGGCYRIEKARILGTNGTEFIFCGLKHNAAGLKSYEAVDICWVEEAQAVSKGSWSTLIPTIRKDGSEIWVSFNPDLEQDATYQMFVVSPPPGAVVRKVNYPENPFFPEPLKVEAEHLRATNPDEYHHVWEGCCISVLEGAIYANELRNVDKEGRITRVPYDATKPVHTFWDIGYGDNCSIWFAQAGAFEYRLIDFLQNNRQPLNWYLQQLQARGYVYGTHWLPWDARPKQFGSGRSVEELMREAGFSVQITPKLSVSDGINAARTIFPQCYFDGEKCADGLQNLRHYRYGQIATLGASTREPLHDEHSHASDAFRYFAVGIRSPERPTPEPEDPYGGELYGTTWMA